MHWSDINPNPDHEDVIKYRNEKIEVSFGQTVNTYEQVIKQSCTNKEVIDFGAANHTKDTQSISENDTHSIVVRYARKISGVDVVDFSQKCPERCHHFVGNFLEESPIPFDKADVVFAGHVIEHLNSPNRLFQFASKVLKDEGQLVVVTPNPLWFVGLYYRNSGRNISVNADHVALFGASELMEIGERAGYLVSKWYYSGKDDMLSEFRPDGRIMSRIINLVYRFSRVMNLAFAHNQIVVIFQKDE